MHRTILLSLMLLTVVMASAFTLRDNRDRQLANLEKQAAKLLDTTGHIRKPKQKAKIKIELGLCYRSMHRYHKWQSSQNKDETVTPEIKVQMKAHAEKALEIFNMAVECFVDVQRDYPKTDSAPVALWYLQEMHFNRNPQKCINFCYELRARYPNAKMPMVVGDRMDFMVFPRIASCYAKLDNRPEAVKAYIQSILSTNDDKHRTARVATLMKYEPRIALEEYQKHLNKELRDILAKAKTDTPLNIVLTSQQNTLLKGEKLTIEYQIDQSDKLNEFLDLLKKKPFYRGHRGYCLAFYAFARESIFIGHTDSLDFYRMKHIFSTDIQLEAGQYHIAAVIMDRTEYTPDQFSSFIFPGEFWCEPILLKVTAGDTKTSTD